MARVADRVRLGGHDVPETVVRRRYSAGLRSFFELYQPLADMWRCYDNSRSSEPHLLAAGNGRLITEVADSPRWQKVQKYIKK